jgi:hypothetical protein
MKSSMTQSDTQRDDYSACEIPPACRQAGVTTKKQLYTHEN